MNILKSAFIVCTVTVITGLVYLGSRAPPPTFNKELNGRENQKKDLLNQIRNFGDSSSFIEVNGLPGVGKTTFIHNVSNILQTNHGYCIVYVKLSEHQSIESVQDYLIRSHQCIKSYLQLTVLFMKELSLTLNIYYNYNSLLLQWYDSLGSNSVLIFDDMYNIIDSGLDKQCEENIIRPILKQSTSRTKIVQVSRATRRHSDIIVPGMDPEICTNWISSNFTSINQIDGRDICVAVGGVPPIVEAIARYAHFKTVSTSLKDIVNRLNDPNPISARRQLESILNDDKIDKAHLDNALHRHYHSFLSDHHKKCIWHLVKINGSFTKDTAKDAIAETNPNVSDDYIINCLDTLLKSSFLSTTEDFVKEYTFNHYIKNFIKSIGDPTQTSKSGTSENFQAMPPLYYENCDVSASSDVNDSANCLIQALASQEIDPILKKLSGNDKLYKYLGSLLAENFKNRDHLDEVMYVLYDRLDLEHKKCAWQIVNLKGTAIFTKDMITNSLEDADMNVDDCLSALLTHSLLQIWSDSHPHQFQFRQNVQKFIQLQGEPLQPHNINLKRLLQNSAMDLYSELESTHDLELAVSIGSNKRLVNNLLPLLYEEYSLSQRDLLTLALNVIQEHYCNPNPLQTASNAKATLAFIYLTKALHCPWFHFPALLSQPNASFIVPEDNTCFDKLKSCPALTSFSTQDYESATALGYHNSFLIYALQMVPWQMYLTDLSFMISVANHECVQYCERTNQCQCDQKMNLEYGLEQFLFHNFERSTKYFEEILKSSSQASQTCQTIIILIAISGIYASGTGNVVASINTLNLEKLNLSCFLGVTYDLIIPFLFDLNWNGSHNLRERFNKTLANEESWCNTSKDIDCGPRYRYTVIDGEMMLKSKQMQDDLKWPQKLTEYDSREEWICSIIQDKTTKCKGDLPLFSQVRSTEAFKKIYEDLLIIKYINNNKFKELFKKAKSIPGFSQYMSI